MMPLRITTALIITVLFSLANAVAFGQDRNREKALKHFDRAVELYQSSEPAASLVEIEKAVKADESFPDPYILKGQILFEQANPAEAAKEFETALNLRPVAPEMVLNLLAGSYFEAGNYPEAIERFEQVLEKDDLPDQLKTSAGQKLRIAEFRNQQMLHPVAYAPVALGEAVNTEADEFINALAADRSGIYLTRKSKNTTMTGRDFNEDFYFAAFRGNSVDSAVKLDYPPGKTNDAGGLSISADSRYLFFTSCFRQDSRGSCDLYYAEKTGPAWSVIKNAGTKVNSGSWESQPSISPDGRTLYFSSNRPGGYGGADIWKSYREEEGSWGIPVNLGPSVNTAGAEMAPFIHFDGKTLFFSSSGHTGMGKADLFKSIYDGNEWSKPENLGYPVNSAADELIVVISPQGEKAYISSNLLDGKGGYDIYSFDLDPKYRPVPVSYVRGHVSDRLSGQPLEAACQLIDLETDSVLFEVYSDKITGEFLVCLPCNKNYALNISSPGYLFYSGHFPLFTVQTAVDPFMVDVLLDRVATGNTLVLRNIFFDTGLYSLQPASDPELKKLKDFLDRNGKVRIEIGGHTDNVGSEESNADLSLKRAEAVYLRLAAMGVEPNRMTYAGYGESMPVGENDTEEGRAQNRRTEIKILGTE